MKSKGKHKWYLSIIDDKLVSFSRGVMHYSWHFYFYICSFSQFIFMRGTDIVMFSFKRDTTRVMETLIFLTTFSFLVSLPSPFLLPSYIALVLKPTFREHLSYHLQQEVGSVNLLLIPKCRLCKGFHSLFSNTKFKERKFSHTFNL